MGLEERKEGNRNWIAEVTEETSGRDGSVHCLGCAQLSRFTIVQFVYLTCVKLIVHQLYLNKLLKETLCLIHFCIAYSRIKFLSQGCFGKKFILILDYAMEMYPWVMLLFNCSVMSHSLWHHGLQHTRLPCPSLSPRVYSNSCPLSQWCLSTISSSLASFSSCPQSSPASGSIPMSYLFTSGGQSIGASASALVLPMKSRLISFIIDWFDFLSLQVTLRSLLQHHDSKASILQHSASFTVLLSHL